MDYSIQSVINKVHRFLLLGLVVVLLPGCRFGQLPNPNSIVVSDQYDGITLQKNVLSVSKMLSDRVMRGEIDSDTRTSVLHDYIKKQLTGFDVKKVGVDQAWRFADVYRQLGEWKTTQQLYQLAVENAPDEDRRVNDTIRLAEADAKLGNVTKGISLVRSTFSANSGGKAPILLATLYEFTPAALGQGLDVEVALLIEDAIDQHLLTYVDPQTEHGKAFLSARRHHIEQAWQKVLGIIQEKGDSNQLLHAIEKSSKTLGRFSRV